MLVTLVVVGVVVLAAAVTYSLWKSGKAVTGASVVAGVESAAVTEAKVVAAAANTAVSKL